jgi:SARP family transcriptional regulator, regulator of embCAB operon
MTHGQEGPSPEQGAASGAPSGATTAELPPAGRSPDGPPSDGRCSPPATGRRQARPSGRPLLGKRQEVLDVQLATQGVATRGRRGTRSITCGLFDLDPAEQVLPTHRVHKGRVVSRHVSSDDPDHLVITVPVGHETALASDHLRHRSPPHPFRRPAYCQTVGVTLASSHPMRIQICGPLVVERDGERVEAGLPGRQGRLLFAYLVVNRHRQVPRDELAEALWREPDPAAVDTRLNPLLSKLRRVFGTDAVNGRSILRLCLPDAWVDLEAAVEAIHRAESSVVQHDWVRAWGPVLTALFVSERGFLPGEDAPWIDEIRHQLTMLRLRALECYAATGLGLAGPELAGAVRAGRQLIHLAPLRESGYRYLMQALAAQDNLAEALHVYTRLCDHLRDQLGVAPSPATRELYQQLLAAT